LKIGLFLKEEIFRFRENGENSLLTGNTPGTTCHPLERGTETETNSEIVASPPFKVRKIQTKHGGMQQFSTNAQKRECRIFSLIVDVVKKKIMKLFFRCVINSKWA
jgi:hypothetical protein